MKKRNVLLGTEGYEGKYVALKSFKDMSVVAGGKIPEKVINKAYSKGYKDAVIFFVPEKGKTYLFKF